MAQTQQMSPAQQQQAMIAQNLQQRQAVLQQGIDMFQPVFPATAFTGGPSTVINVPLRNVGLNKRLIVRVDATFTNPAGPTQNLTTLGPSNFFSQIVLTDLQNQQRINTAQWHLHQVNTAKRRRVFGAAYTSDTPTGYGNNFPKVFTVPASIASNTTSHAFFYVEIPIAYSDHDLRGAIWANVTNAVWSLQLTVNPNLFAGNAATDTTFAMWQSTTATLGTLPTFTLTVYQNYLDQIPTVRDPQSGQVAPILPLLDISTAYLFNNTTLAGLVANSDFPIPFANFRDFMSTTVIYDNAGTLGTGDDINYWALQTANFTNILREDPYTADLMGARLIFMDDCPKGMYYFDHRVRPIAIQQYGNEQLVINPITVGGATANVAVGWEALALINMVTQSGSLAAG